MKRTAIFLYEPEQLASLDALIAKWSTRNENPIIVSLDAEVDFALERRGISFVSGKMLQDRTAPSAYMRADKFTSDLCDSTSLSFLRYRGVSLLTPLRLSIHIYFIYLFYYLDVIERFMETSLDVERLVVPFSPVHVSKTSGSLAAEEVKVVFEAARLIAEMRGILCESHDTFPVSLEAKNRRQERMFMLKRTLFGAALSLLNAFMALRRRRHIRILASDYWRNISPILRELPEAETILLDRGQAMQAGLANIWRHKMQFMHIEQFLSRSGKQHADAYARECVEKWKAVSEEMLASVDLTFRGVSFFTTAERILSHIIKSVIPNVICDIEGTYTMYERFPPDAVLLRASVSGQRHFAILPLVAREAGVPALEVQHGIEYLGHGSGTLWHPAYFLATYGPLVTGEFRNLGYEEERLFSAGSPRFDEYVHAMPKDVARKKMAGITILSNTPTIDISARYGTYSIEEYFKALGDAVRETPDARLLIASRSISNRAVFNEEARTRGLANVRYESVGIAPLPGLFQQADIFVCGYSTVVYEALLYHLPVIIVAFSPVEMAMVDFHFSGFRDAGALHIAHSPEELRDMLQKLSSDHEARARMSTAGWEFMQKNFSFDGHASERIAKLIRNWSTHTIP